MIRSAQQETLQAAKDSFAKNVQELFQGTGSESESGVLLMRKVSSSPANRTLGTVALKSGATRIRGVGGQSKVIAEKEQKRDPIMERPSVDGVSFVGRRWP